jgi:hypothetical protein
MMEALISAITAYLDETTIKALIDDPDRFENLNI